jgi:SAM-dependent methyltransferase
MTYLSPVPSADAARPFYDLILGDAPVGGVAQPGSRPLRKFRPHDWPAEAGNGRLLLDVGCGAATKLVGPARRGWRVVGVDVSADSITAARRNVPEGEFFVGDLSSARIQDSTCDVVRLDNVLEHINEPVPLLAECRRLLRPRGLLLLYVPNGDSLSMRALKRNSISSWIPFHVSLFNPKTLRSALSAAGFTDVTDWTYTPADWLPLSLLQLFGARPGTTPQLLYRGLRVACFPMGLLAERWGIGEELVAAARAP